MLYNVLINQSECIKMGLTHRHGALLYLLSMLSTWADTAVVDDVVYYKLAYTKIITELPLYFNSRDTVYKCIKTLRDLGLIEQSKIGKLNINYIRLTAEGSAFLRVGQNAQASQGWANLQQRVGQNAQPCNNAPGAENITDNKQGWANLPHYNNNNTIDKKQKEKKDVFFIDKSNGLKMYADTVANFFGVTIEAQKIKVYSFLRSIDDLDYFKKQFEYYQKYKTTTGERVHRFESFTAEWFKNDYEALLNKFNAPAQNIPTAGYRKRISI